MPPCADPRKGVTCPLMSLIISVSGVRGVVGRTLTPEVASEFAAAMAAHLDGGDVVVGRDSRPSGVQIQAAVVEALVRGGCRVIDLGVVSTPGAALMTRQTRAAGGIVITASHNPGEWNGLKFLTAEGCAPGLEELRPIWKLREQGCSSRPGPARRGTITEDRTTNEQHVEAVRNVVHPQVAAANRFRVVLDSVNGAGGQSGRMLLEALGCEVVHINAEPTGEFAHLPEPTAENLTELCTVVRSVGADIGFAQDPDADRLAVVDEQGVYIGEEYTLALATMYAFGDRPGPAATNLSTSRMIDDLAARASPPCQVHRTAVGEANVVDAMRCYHCVIGGEGNGGVIDPRVVLVRDSLTALALILQLLAELGRPLSSIVGSIPRYVMLKKKLSASPEQIAGALRAIRSRFAGDRVNDTDGVRIDWPEGWVHVRGSNTEPIMRLIAEGSDRQTAERLLHRVREASGL